MVGASLGGILESAIQIDLVAGSGVLGREESSCGSAGAGEVLWSRGQELVGHEGLVLGEAEELVVAVFEELHGHGAVVVQGLGVS